MFLIDLVNLPPLGKSPKKETLILYTTNCHLVLEAGVMRKKNFRILNLLENTT